MYSGRLVTVPTTISQLSRLQVSKLRAILQFHGIPITGTKEQLVLRVLLLQQGQTSAIVARQEQQLLDFISVHEKLIIAQRKLALSSHTYFRRAFSSRSDMYGSFEPPPENIRDPSDLPTLFFTPLIGHIEAQHRGKRDQQTLIQLTKRGG